MAKNLRPARFGRLGPPAKRPTRWHFFCERSFPPDTDAIMADPATSTALPFSHEFHY
jgi:hypothetical protein